MPVSCDSSPFVRPGDIFMGARVYHWLDGKDMPFFHKPCCFVVGIMRYIWGRMEERAGTVTAVCSIDSKSKLYTIYPFYSMYFVMMLPTSRYIVPGLHISNAFCREL